MAKVSIDDLVAALGELSPSARDELLNRTIGRANLDAFRDIKFTATDEVVEAKLPESSHLWVTVDPLDGSRPFYLPTRAALIDASGWAAVIHRVNVGWRWDHEESPRGQHRVKVDARLANAAKRSNSKVDSYAVLSILGAGLAGLAVTAGLSGSLLGVVVSSVGFGAIAVSVQVGKYLGRR